MISLDRLVLTCALSPHLWIRRADFGGVTDEFKDFPGRGRASSHRRSRVEDEFKDFPGHLPTSGGGRHFSVDKALLFFSTSRCRFFASYPLEVSTNVLFVCGSAVITTPPPALYL